MSTVPAPGAPRRAAPNRQFRHIRSSLTSYDKGPRKVKRDRRRAGPSPAAGRVGEAPRRDPWADLLDVPIDALDLEAFGDDGSPLVADPEHALARWGVA